MRLLLKIVILSLYLLSNGSAMGQNASMVHEGHYQGENIYLQNPLSDEGAAFCVDSVLVNGTRTLDKINDSAFEVDFSRLNLEVGDRIIMVVYHKADCLPKVLNPTVGGSRLNRARFTEVKIE